MRAEEEAKAAEEKKLVEERDGKGDGETGSGADDEGESTEVEGDGDNDAVSSSYGGLGSSRGDLSLSGFEEGAVRSGREEEGEDAVEVRQRIVKTQQGGDLSGEVSTDSEWEKVEDGR